MGNSLKTFHDSCKRGDRKTVISFLNNNPDAIDTPSKEGWTALIIACHKGENEIARLLIEKGANVNAVNNKGTTVFMYAKTPIQNVHKDTSLLSYLLQNGADINKKDVFEKTVLDYVFENGDLHLINWLKSNGAKKAKSKLI